MWGVARWQEITGSFGCLCCPWVGGDSCHPPRTGECLSAVGWGITEVEKGTSLSSFGDRWVPGIHDSPTVNEGRSACPLSWQAWSLRGRGQLLGPHRALMGRGQARSPSPPALGTKPSPHPRHRQAARLPLPCRPLPLVSFLSSALPQASCRPLLSSFAWSSSVPWPLPSALRAFFCSESGSVSSLAWKVYMGPYPAFCLQRALNGFVGLVGVEGGEEE